MRAQDFITEIGNKPYKMGRWKYGTSSTRLPDGRILSISFEPIYSDPNYVLLSFSVDDALITTGGGDAYRIFATLTRAVNNYVDSNYPELLVWGVNEKDSSRVKLFNRLTQRWLQLPALRGYENLTEHKELWPEDLELAVDDMHGSNLKIYVLASEEYMEYLQSASDMED